MFDEETYPYYFSTYRVVVLKFIFDIRAGIF